MRRSLAIGLLAVAPLGASTYLFATGPVQLAGGLVNAQAQYEIDDLADTIAISIVNLQPNPVSVGQLVSGISFTLSHFAGAASNAAITGERATRIEIDRMGRVVEIGPTLDTDWKILPAGADTLDLCTICKSTGDPDELVIGAPAAGGRYTAANGSIAGNGPHNPFLMGPIWTVHLSGIQPATLVATTIFRFGTTYGDLTAAGYESIPEPGTVGMIVAGAGALWIARRRRTKGQKV